MTVDFAAVVSDKVKSQFLCFVLVVFLHLTVGKVGEVGVCFLQGFLTMFSLNLNLLKTKIYLDKIKSRKTGASNTVLLTRSTID